VHHGYLTPCPLSVGTRPLGAWCAMALEQVWLRVEDHQKQIDCLRSAHRELWEENASLRDVLESNLHVGMRLSAQLHRRRFEKALKRFPLPALASQAVLPVVQMPGIALLMARFAGLPAIARIAASTRAMSEAATAAISEIRSRPKIYVIGGVQSRQALDVVESFDPESGKWSDLAPMPTPRSDLAAAVVDGKLYAIGGYDGRTLADMELFDPQSNVWEDLPPMPTPRSDFAAAAESGHVYRLGGLDEYYEALDTVERFDLDIHTWEVLAPMRIARWSFAVAAISGRLYAIGGFADGQALGVVERYDPDRGDWESLCAMPTPRSAFAAATVGGRVYAIGGSSPGLGRALDIVERYDPETNIWEGVSQMPTPRSRFSAAAVGGRIYTFGGFDDTGTETLNAVERYDPETDVWEALPPMPTPRSGAAVLSC